MSELPENVTFDENPQVPVAMLVGVALFAAGVLFGVLAVRWLDAQVGAPDTPASVVRYEVPNPVKVTGYGWTEEGF